MSPFDLFWKHVQSCDVCSHASHGMCREGEKLLETATTYTAKAMAPEPKEPAKA